MSAVKQKDTRLDTFAQRLRAERERLGLTQPEWGALVGVEKNAQGNYESGKRSPDANYLMAAAKSGADVLYLLTGERSEASLPDTAVEISNRIRRQALAQAMSASDDDLVEIPLYAVHLMAGSGHENGEERRLSAIGFPKPWLRSLGVSPVGAVLAFARGESMRPTIQDGDVLLIDQHAASRLPPQRSVGDTRPVPIFAVHDDGGARVKRLLTLAQGNIVLLSDNPEVPPEFRLAADISIIGRVVWWGHTERA